MKRGQTGRRKTSGWLLAIVAAGLLGLIAVVRLASSPKPVYVMTINGEPVDLREYMLLFNRHRSEVYNDFNLKYGAQDSPNFWTTAYGGEVPLDKLKQVTLQDLISIKVQQLQARQRRVVVALTPQGPFIPADPSYAAFLANLQRENQRRQAALQKGEAVYGPTQYDEDGFYRYFFSRMVEQLKQQLSQGDWAPSDQTLEALYADRKDADYKRADTIELESLCQPYAESDGKISPASKQAVVSQMAEIRTQLTGGESFQTAAQSATAQYAQDTLDDATAQTDLKFRPTLTAQAGSLAPGAISDPFENDEGSAVCVIRVTGRQAGGYRPFDEIRGQVQELYIDEKYNALVEQLVREAKVEIQPEIYNKIQGR